MHPFAIKRLAENGPTSLEFHNAEAAFQNTIFTDRFVTKTRTSTVVAITITSAASEMCGKIKLLAIV